jgi:hypothetical protein
VPLGGIVEQRLRDYIARSRRPIVRTIDHLLLRRDENLANVCRNVWGLQRPATRARTRSRSSAL